jgi:hypothetical protein
LPNQADWITVEQLVSAGMIEKNGHQIADFRAAAFRQRQASEPRFNLDGSDLSQFEMPPLRKNPASQVRSVSFLGCVAAPSVIPRQLSLLKVIAELRDRNGPRTNPRLFRIDLL